MTMTKTIKKQLIESLVPLAQLHGVVRALELTQKAIKQDEDLKKFLELIMKHFPDAVMSKAGERFLALSQAYFPPQQDPHLSSGKKPSQRK